MYLNVPVPDFNENKNTRATRTTIKDCIKEFSKEEKLEGTEQWFCSLCKKFNDCSKKIDIWKSPNILIIHLKRFKYTKRSTSKIRTIVDFPINDLNLEDLVAGKQKNKPIYDLFAVCVFEKKYQ